MDSKTLVLGERLLVTLPGLGAAGYRWAAAIDPPAVVSVERVALGSGSDDRQAGASRDEAFALTAVAVGEGNVRFAQARRFEPGREPHAVREMHVRVIPAND
jgi:hypothetical protein